MSDLDIHIEKLLSIPDLAIIIQPLVDEIIRLRKRVEELESQINKNSSNSSKPPSSDGYKRTIKNNRIKSGKKIGGQKGHEGSSLEFSATPDTVVDIPSPSHCPCGQNLSETPTKGIDRRQVYDIPPMRIHVSEYRLEVKKCPCCGKSCSGTSPIASNVGYGPGIKSIASYLNIYQMLPFARVQEFYSDVFNHSVSGGFLQSCNQQHYDALALSEQGIKNALSKSPWIAADETSSRCMSKNNWVHVAGNATHTYYHADTKRGSDAIERAGVIQGYQGVVSHDRYASYDKFELTHQLCCVHLLRELRFLFEEKGIKWAKSLYEWLLWGNGFKKSGSITGSERALVEKNYDFIVEMANLSTPRAEKSAKSRGRPKQSEERNLLDAFIERKNDILRFMYNAHAPFDNNQAERDLRMIKVKQKISGCFRTEKGLKVFCRIRSYISTARKQGLDVLEALIMAMKGEPHFA